MQQPQGFIDPMFSAHLCRLHKVIYGLKQAPRAWFQRFTSFLLELGFQRSNADSSLFIRREKTSILILLIYVDDIIVKGNNFVVLVQLITHLVTVFAMKDLGKLHYFLGLQVYRNRSGLFVCQTKYVVDLLQRWKLDGVKSHSTPVSRGQKLSNQMVIYYLLSQIIGA